MNSCTCNAGHVDFCIFQQFRTFHIRNDTVHREWMLTLSTEIGFNISLNIINIILSRQGHRPNKCLFSGHSKSYQVDNNTITAYTTVTHHLVSCVGYHQLIVIAKKAGIMRILYWWEIGADNIRYYTCNIYMISQKL
jgi:hypothetical protein